MTQIHASFCRALPLRGLLFGLLLAAFCPAMTSDALIPSTMGGETTASNTATASDTTATPANVERKALIVVLPPRTSRHFRMAMPLPLACSGCNYSLVQSTPPSALNIDFRLTPWWGEGKTVLPHPLAITEITDYTVTPSNGACVQGVNCVKDYPCSVTIEFWYEAVANPGILGLSNWMEVSDHLDRVHCQVIVGKPAKFVSASFAGKECESSISWYVELVFGQWWTGWEGQKVLVFKCTDCVN